MSKYLKRDWPILIILLIGLIAAVVLYPSMPDKVPIHWNFRGEVDNYGSREFGTFFLPALNVILYVLFLVMPNFDPKKENYRKFDSSYLTIRYSLHIFLALLFGLTAAASLGYPVDIGKWVAVGVALLFIAMGNIMGRVRNNYFVGFKFPWTLANEDVWKKTHQVGAKAMVAGGIFSLIGVILTSGSLSFVLLMAGIFIPMILVAVYSYLIYKRIEN